MASTAATMMGKYAGSQPAMTALTASFSERGLAPERRHGAQRPLGVGAGQHDPDALLGGRHDGQPIAPATLAELGEDRLGIVVDVDEGSGSARTGSDPGPHAPAR